MSEHKISVYFITHNEADTIAEAINSVSELDEIIVVDSGSSDGTVEIAQDLGARVLHQDWLGFAKQKAFALAQCRNQWCFNLDADEVVPNAALDEIKKWVNSGKCEQIRLPFEDILMQKPMHARSRKRSIVRVFKKDTVRYPEHRLVHENIIGSGREVKIKNLIIHYGYADVATLMAKQNTYSSLGAKEKFNKGKKASIAKLILVFSFTFIKVYLFRRLFLSGVRGLIQASIEAMYAFLKEAKLYEYQFLAKVKRATKRGSKSLEQ